MSSKMRTRVVVTAGMCAALTLTGASVAIADEASSARQEHAGEVTTSAGKFMIGDTSYDTLALAVNSVTNADATTITLTGDASGDGVVVGEGKNIVFDLAGHTYTVNGKLVGSSGTETNGFQLLKDSAITFKNGTVASDSAKILIQNYSNLTLDGVTVKGGSETQYALSNNNGTTVIKNGSNIIAGGGSGQVAFDVCGFGEYAGASVTVEKNAGKIEGVIELSSNEKQHELSLNILGGDLSRVTLKDASGAEAVKVTKAANVTLAAPQGYQWVENTLIKPTENIKAAAVTADGAVSTHATVSEALNTDGVSKVILLDDATEDVSIAAGKTVTLDLAGHTLTNQTSDTVTVVLGGSLTVVDSGEGGIIDNKTNGSAAVFNSGIAVLEGGAYDRTAETGESPEVSKRNSWYTICNHGEMTIKAGASVKNKGNFSSMIENGYQSYRSGNPRTGHIEGVNAANPTLTIEGGDFDGGLNAVKNDDGGKMAITSGTFTNSTQATFLNWNEATISGGTFKATSSAKACVLNGASTAAANEYDKGDLKISGGTFTVDGGTACIVNYITDKVPVVTGGAFSSDPSAFVPTSGYVVSQSGGVWTVSKYVPPVTPPSDKTEVEHGDDGSTTTTVTRPDGSQTITHETATGTESVVKKDKDGNVTSTKVTVSKTDAENGRVELPIENAEPAADAGKAQAVEVDVPSIVTAEKPVQVTVPVAKAEGAEPNYGIVVYAVDAEGNEAVLPKSAVDKDGNVVFQVTGDVTIKVADNAKEMPDVTETDWFAGDVVDFATARGIVNGVLMDDGTREFQGNGGTTRAMFVGMLHNLELAPKASTGDSLGDVSDTDWFADAAAWALESGVLEGVDTGSGREFRGDSLVTREQVAVFLMRYSEMLGLDVSGRAEIAFVDGAETSVWAREAMSWAVSEGLFTGNAATGELNPTSGATRAEVATVLMRFISQVLLG